MTQPGDRGPGTGNREQGTVNSEQGVSGTSSLALGPRERKCNETSIRPKTRIPVDVSDVQYKAEK